MKAGYSNSSTGKPRVSTQLEKGITPSLPVSASCCHGGRNPNKGLRRDTDPGFAFKIDPPASLLFSRRIFSAGQSCSATTKKRVTGLGADPAAVNSSRVTTSCSLEAAVRNWSQSGCSAPVPDMVQPEMMTLGIGIMHEGLAVEVDEIARQQCGDAWNAAVDFIVRKGFLWRPHLEPHY